MVELVREYVKEYKKIKKLDSYAQVMESLGIQRAAWTKINNGGGVSEETAIKIAETLKIEPLEIIAVSKAFSSKNQEVKAVWIKLAKKLIKEKEKKKKVHNKVQT